MTTGADLLVEGGRRCIVPDLEYGQKHLLYLIQRDIDAEGWTKVSSVVWPLVANLPPELIELRPSDDGGHVRLTSEGGIVLKWMQ